jgi:DNA-binding CsgD family transcriptional regulator
MNEVESAVETMGGWRYGPSRSGSKWRRVDRRGGFGDRGPGGAEDSQSLSALRGAALSAVSIGLFIVQRGGRVLDLNQVAEQLLAAGCLRQWGEVLTTAEACDARPFEALVEAATRSDAPRCGAMRLDGDSEAPCLATVVPLTCPDGLPNTALVAVQAGVRGGPANPRHLQSMFGLTAAESELAVLFGQGFSIAEAAKARNVSVGTAKSQLYAITAKLGVRRQSELGVTIASLPKLTWAQPSAAKAKR